MKILLKKILDSLRWKEDMKVVNPFGDYVWLKPLYVEGERLGITDCCFVANPCEYHRILEKEHLERN